MNLLIECQESIRTGPKILYARNCKIFTKRGFQINELRCLQLKKVQFKGNPSRKGFIKYINLLLHFRKIHYFTWMWENNVHFVEQIKNILPHKDITSILLNAIKKNAVVNRIHIYQLLNLVKALVKTDSYAYYQTFSILSNVKKYNKVKPIYINVFNLVMFSMLKCVYQYRIQHMGEWPDSTLPIKWKYLQGLWSSKKFKVCLAFSIMCQQLIAPREMPSRVELLNTEQVRNIFNAPSMPQEPPIKSTKNTNLQKLCLNKILNHGEIVKSWSLLINDYSYTEFYFAFKMYLQTYKSHIININENLYRQMMYNLAESLFFNRKKILQFYNVIILMDFNLYNDMVIK